MSFEASRERWQDRRSSIYRAPFRWPASVHEQIQAELAKKREADEKIKKLKAKEAVRLGRIADKVGLYEVPVSDEDLAAGLEHAIERAKGRTNDKEPAHEAHAST